MCIGTSFLVILVIMVNDLFLTAVYFNFCIIIIALIFKIFLLASQSHVEMGSHTNYIYAYVHP